MSTTTASKIWDVLLSVAHLVPQNHSMYQKVQDALDAGAKDFEVEQIKKALVAAYKTRDKHSNRTHESRVDFNAGEISAYEHCLAILGEGE